MISFMNEENKLGFEWGKLGLFVLSFLLVLGGVMLIDQKIGSLDQKSEVSQNTSVDENSGELKIEDIVVGSGAEAVSGKSVTVHYTGTLTDGTKFDSSLDRGTPYTFILGAGEVIQGWDQGVAGMKVGGKRKLTIPPSLGYGAEGAGDQIPPNSTLIFEVELLKVE